MLPSPFVPRADVHLAAIDRDLVVLDLGTDAYFCLPDAVTRRDGSPLSRLSRLARQTLADAGLLDPSDSVSGPASPLPAFPLHPPVRDLRDLPAIRPSPGDTITAGLALFDLARLGPDPTTARLLSLATPERGAPLEATSSVRSDVVRAARVFADLLPWLPFEGACLRRSALLLAFLRRRGLAARWVFGVRVWPFRAHCWVQIDDLCLNDDVERLRAYTPILVA